MAKNPQRTAGPAGPVLPWLRTWHVALVVALGVGLVFRDVLLQRAYFWEDFIYQYYAFRDFAAVSLSQGHIPLWNPYTFSGMPFQADIQTAVFYLPNLLLTFFVQGDRLPFYWVEFIIVAHFLVAGVAMAFLAGEFGLERPYALFAGLVYALSGFMVTHAIHHTFISQVAWTPLVVLFFRRALLGRSLAAMALSALFLGLSILGGAPQFTLYTFLFLLAYFLFEFVGATRAEGLARSFSMAPIALGVIVLAVGLTAIQLLPTFELAGLSARAQITFEKSSESSLRYGQLLTLLAPKYFGASGAQESTYWLAPSSWDYWETCLYVGVPGILSMGAALALVRRERTVAFLFGAAAFALLYALGDNFVLHGLFFRFVPGFDKFRIPGRMSFLFTFSAAILAGYGLRWLLSSAPAPAFRRYLAAAAGAGVLVFLAAQVGLFQPAGAAPMAVEAHATAVRAATGALLLTLGFCALVLLASRRALPAAAALAGVLLLQIIDINVFGASQNSGTVNPDDYYNRTASIVDVIKRDQATEYFRVNARQGGAMIIDRNQGMVDRIFLMEGYTPLSLQRIYPPAPDWSRMCDLLNAKYRISVDQRARTMGLERATTYLPRAFVVHDARVMEDSAVEPFMQRPSFDPSRTVVLEEPPAIALADTAADPSAKATITSYSENAIALDVTTAKAGMLVLSEIYYPGWTATVDGKETKVQRADWNLRALAVGPGRHSVEVRFAPVSYARGAWISIVAIIACAGLLAFGRFRRPAAPAEAA